MLLKIKGANRISRGSVMETRIKYLFSDENYVKALFETGSYEAAVDKLKEDGVEVSVEELKKAVDLANKKAQGELTDEDLEEIAGGGIAGGVLVIATTSIFVGFTAKNLLKSC